MTWVVSVTVAMFDTRVVSHPHSCLQMWVCAARAVLQAVIEVAEDVSGCMTPPHSCPPMRVHRIRVIRIGTVGHMIYIVGLHTSVVRRVQCCKLCYSTPYDMSMVVGHSSLLSVNLAFDC